MTTSEQIHALQRKLGQLQIEQAKASDPAIKFGIGEAIKDVQLALSELGKKGLVVGELDIDAIDKKLLRSYFKQCAQYDSEYKAAASGKQKAMEEFLLANGFAFKSGNGDIALTDEGMLFCAAKNRINKSLFDVEVVLYWGSEQSPKQEHILGSVLFLHQKLMEKLMPLTERVMGDPNIRNEWGSEVPIYEYPPVAMVEVLVNFLIHRDYRLIDHARVMISNDCIEFINPGISTFPIDELLSATKAVQPNYSRNVPIIRAMSWARLNQKMGSGILRIRDELKRNGTFLDNGSIGLKLENNHRQNRFHLTLYRRDLTELLYKSNLGEKKNLPIIDISRLISYAPTNLIGREDEVERLDKAWDLAVGPETQRPHILVLVGMGGEGKTSLLAKWTASLAHKGWPGCEAVFAWSFYSQGTANPSGSSEAFLNQALAFFGDKALSESSEIAFNKGQRLARLVGEKKALLLLDGLEPLQYAPSSATAGELKDKGLAALLRGLAANSKGLCVLTTRYSIPDLQVYWQTTVQQWRVSRLSVEAGVALLQSLGVKGSRAECAKAVEEVKGHALTLHLLGAWLRDAHFGDIRRRRLVSYHEADMQEQGGRAFRVMDAYSNWFEREGENGQRALAVLRLLGLFDRPATAGCIDALLCAPVINGLTDVLVGIQEVQWHLTLSRLEAAKILVVYRDSGNRMVAMDAHPLLREYFAWQIQTQQLVAWQAAHRRIYDYLCAATLDTQQPTLDDLQPLYQAVAHGCLAGMQQETVQDVYLARILRRNERYSVQKLGAFGSDLGAIACFFEQPWKRVSPGLAEADQAWLLNEAAFLLRALGRLPEAMEPLRAGLAMRVQQKNWREAAICAGNLAELALSLGDLPGAIAVSTQAVSYADRSDEFFLRIGLRAAHADALYQAGQQETAQQHFCEAEAMQAKFQPDYPLLYSVHSFRYCDLLLALPEQAAWRQWLFKANCPPEVGGQELSRPMQACHAVANRATMTLQWVMPQAWLLDIALDYLSLGRAALYEVILADSATNSSHEFMKDAVDGLRRAGQQGYLPGALLSRAWERCIAKQYTGPDSAQADLDEAWEIAARGPMPLFLADIHLYRARLFGEMMPYPWQSPIADLRQARQLIEKHGYLRRMAELLDAEVVLQI